MAKAKKKAPSSNLKKVYDGRFDDASAAVLVCVPPEGRIISVNVEAEELTGYERSELEGMALSDIFRPEDKARIDSIFSSADRMDFRKLFEHNVIVRKRSRRKIIVDMGFRRTGSAGDALVFTLQDITDLKLNEERVIRASEYVNNIIDSMIEFLLVADGAGRIEKVNGSALMMLGYDEAEIVGQPLSCVLPELPAGIKAFAEQETVVRAKDGRTIQVLASRSELKHGPSTGSNKTVVVAMDIEGRKKSERLIQEQQMMLVQASKMSSLGEMASSIAHEINNPLMVILGRCELLEMMADAGKTKAPPEIRSGVELINKMSRRILKIVRGLQALARDQRQDAMDVVDLGEIVRDTLALCEQRIRIGVENLYVPAFDSPFLIRCRPTQISQVILNLVNNSYDEVQSRPLNFIKIEATTEGRDVIIAVTDSGKGLPPAVAEKLFTPFFTTKPVGKGTGIGLSVSKSLIESHGGTLEFDSSCPNTRFVIRLPEALVEQASQQAS
jgi:PAS domain S-box-containing protein